MKPFEKIFPLLILVGVLLNANGMLLDILEPDGALYATIAKHIALSGDWINLWGDGHDWLDKPHFPFWVAALSLKLFGINASAYKLPAFIFWLAGIRFTYCLTELFYDKFTAKVAAVLYIFSLHGILNNFDVRAEPFLTTLSIGAIYYFYKSHLSGKWKHIVLTALYCACAVMTKGIFVLITIGAGFVIWWIITRQWKQFFNYRWYMMLLLILLFMAPELYSLYTQFDMHPEKVVFGKTNVSGLRFFFWDSQFGRFFNTGPIKGNGDKSFFLHTTLWAFLPWSILLYCGVVQLIRKGKLSAEKNYNRWVIYGSTLITFLLFSLSGFQLPHYITILFPQFSIITAAYLTSIKTENTLRKIKVLQIVLLLLSVTTIVMLSWYSKIGFSIVPYVIIGAIALFALMYGKGNSHVKIITTGSALSLVLFVYLFNYFYPQLLSYQAGMMAGKWLQQNKTYPQPAAVYNDVSYSFEFYAPGYVDNFQNIAHIDTLLQKNPATVFFTSENDAKNLVSNGYNITYLKWHPYFHISMLTLPFLNPATRQSELEKMCLVQLQKVK